MKIRILDHLESHLSADLKRRKLELSEMHGAVRRNQNIAHRVLIRAGVMLLYSHWEGFVKEAASAYINYVSHQSLTQDRLAPSFLAICLREELRTCGVVRPSHHTALVELLRSDLKALARVPDGVVDAKDNLRGDVFREIAALLGIDFARYAAKENFISYTLCDIRNEIGHGRLREVSSADYDFMHHEVIWLIDAFRDDVINAAVTSRFMA